MNINDHPPPHFHVQYGSYKASVNIRSGAVIEGELPPRAYRLVNEWFELHQGELEANWQRVEAELPLFSIAPL